MWPFLHSTVYVTTHLNADYKFPVRSNQIRRIKSGVIFQPSFECSINKLGWIKMQSQYERCMLGMMLGRELQDLKHKSSK